jgi:hypothetical protein
MATVALNATGLRLAGCPLGGLVPLHWLFSNAPRSVWVFGAYAVGGGSR